MWHSCGLVSDGTAYCWGRNFFGALGTGDTTSHASPTPVAGGLQFSSIAIAELSSCGLTQAGAAYCWGDNRDGQVGISPAPTAVSQPMAVEGGLTFVSLSAGGDHACGIANSGLVYCWGANESGQLGVTSPESSPTPVAVLGQR